MPRMEDRRTLWPVTMLHFVIDEHDEQRLRRPSCNNHSLHINKGSQHLQAICPH